MVHLGGMSDDDFHCWPQNPVRPDLRGYFWNAETFSAVTNSASGYICTTINAMMPPLKSNQLQILARCALSVTVLMLAVILLLVMNGQAREDVNRKSATKRNFELEENTASPQSILLQPRLYVNSMQGQGQIQNEDWIKISKWSKLHRLASIDKLAQISSKNSVKSSNLILSNIVLGEKSAVGNNMLHMAVQDIPDDMLEVFTRRSQLSCR
jgi:hypothetical protein